MKQMRDALVKALMPKPPHKPEQKTDKEPSFSRKFQGPPTVQPQDLTDD